MKCSFHGRETHKSVNIKEKFYKSHKEPHKSLGIYGKVGRVLNIGGCQIVLHESVLDSLHFSLYFLSMKYLRAKILIYVLIISESGSLGLTSPLSSVLMYPIAYLLDISYTVRYSTDISYLFYSQSPLFSLPNP